jgi:hypothetical protein
VKVLPWDEKLTGYQLTIDQGIGGASNIEIDDCILSNIKFYPQRGGGAVQVKFDLESPNVSDKTWGKLARMKSVEVEVVLLAPTIDQQDFDDQPSTVEQLRKGKPDATDAFVAAHGNS